MKYLFLIFLSGLLVTVDNLHSQTVRSKEIFTDNVSIKKNKIKEIRIYEYRTPKETSDPNSVAKSELYLTDKYFYAKNGMKTKIWSKGVDGLSNVVYTYTYSNDYLFANIKWYYNDTVLYQRGIEKYTKTGECYYYAYYNQKEDCLVDKFGNKFSCTFCEENIKNNKLKLQSPEKYTYSKCSIRAHEYDSLNNVKVDLYDGIVDKSYNYEYDTLKRIKTRTTYDKNNKIYELHTFTYDSAGNILQKEIKHFTYTLIQSYVYAHDSLGNIIQEKINVNGAETKYEYYYDSNNLLIQITKDSKLLMEIQRNSKGLETKRIIWRSNGIHEIRWYEYSYY